MLNQLSALYTKIPAAWRGRLETAAVAYVTYQYGPTAAAALKCVAGH